MTWQINNIDTMYRWVNCSEEMAHEAIRHDLRIRVGDDNDFAIIRNHLVDSGETEERWCIRGKVRHVAD